MAKQLKREQRRSEAVFVAFRPIEHAALKLRAEQTGTTMSSTVRQVVLRDLFAQANKKAGK